MTRKSAPREISLGRRALLSTAGAAVGTGAVTGFPTIWAQNIKDVVLQHAGPPVTAIPAIAEQASKDLGFTVHMQASENADLLNRFLSQSSSIDCADVSVVFMKYLVGRDILQSIPVAKIKDWDKTIPIFTKGEYPDGRKASRQGVMPLNVLYTTGADGKRSATARRPTGSPESPPSPTATPWASAPIWWSALSPVGPICSAPTSRARPLCRINPPSVSSMSPWPWKRAAILITATKAT